MKRLFATQSSALAWLVSRMADKGIVSGVRPKEGQRSAPAPVKTKKPVAKLPKRRGGKPVLVLSDSDSDSDSDDDGDVPILAKAENGAAGSQRPDSDAAKELTSSRIWEDNNSADDLFEKGQKAVHKFAEAEDDDGFEDEDEEEEEVEDEMAEVWDDDVDDLCDSGAEEDDDEQQQLLLQPPYANDAAASQMDVDVVDAENPSAQSAFHQTPETQSQLHQSAPLPGVANGSASGRGLEVAALGAVASSDTHYAGQAETEAKSPGVTVVRVKAEPTASDHGPGIARSEMQSMAVEPAGSQPSSQVAASSTMEKPAGSGSAAAKALFCTEACLHERCGDGEMIE